MLKLLARNMIARILDLLPAALLEPIRRGHATADARTFRKKNYGFLARILRYRNIDESVRDFVVPNAPHIRLTRDNSVVTRSVYWLGTEGYEPHVLSLWLALCGRAREIVEIGANIGYFTVAGAMAAPAATYTAVEPHPVTVRLLRANVELNDLENVRIVEAAAVGRKTEDVMELGVPAGDPDSAPAGAHLLAGVERSDVVRDSVSVEVVEAAEIIGNADVVKIDAEGAEHGILSGVLERLKTSAPTVVIEVLPNTPRLRRLLAELATEGVYEILAIGRRRTHPLSAREIASIDLERSYKTRDVLLSPRRG